MNYKLNYYNYFFSAYIIEAIYQRIKASQTNIGSKLEIKAIDRVKMNWTIKEIQ